jgi:hypothetical protein
MKLPSFKRAYAHIGKPVIALLSLLGCGCAAMIWDDTPRFTVIPNPLAHLEMTYQPAAGPGGATNDMPIWVSIRANGMADCRIGRSKRVADSFWTDAKNSPDWASYHEDQRILPQEEIIAFLQRAVDLGVFEKQPKKLPPGVSLVAIHADINSRKADIISANPEYLNLIRDILQSF